MLTVKENQPTLHDDVQTYFNDPEACYEQAQTIDRHKGRLEVRQIRVTSSMNASPFLLARASPSGENSSATSRLPGNTAKTWSISLRICHLSKPALIAYSSSFEVDFRIENGLHDVRDVTFQEGRSHIRTGPAPQILAALRNLVITLIHRQGSTQIAVTRRWFAFHPEKVLAVLLSSWAPSQ